MGQSQLPKSKDENGNHLWRYNEEVVVGSEVSQFDFGTGAVRIPEWVRGENLVICNDVLQGKSYKQIGEALGLTTKAVEKRLERIRERTRTEKETAA
jgi:hypothetical protein